MDITSERGRIRLVPEIYAVDGKMYTGHASRRKLPNYNYILGSGAELDRLYCSAARLNGPACRRMRKLRRILLNELTRVLQTGLGEINRPERTS
jgi:hypothetical protein